ncbi:MAG: xanthine dehydrogenase family protein molybdopterin-binding subunit [Lachnospiraceae bacterium]|jgi:CO/xanthine dehydrogenase Mo-binding subunit
MSEYRFIGKDVRRQDGKGIVTGKALYCDDLQIEGAHYMKVLRSPYPHAEVLSIDTSLAEEMTGVVSVMTYKNAPGWKCGMPASRPVLDHHLRHVGDPVATVVARSANIAEEAVKLIKVEYEELEPVFDVEDAIKDGAPEVYRAEDNIESKGNVYHNNQLPPGSWFEGEDAPFYFIREGSKEKGLADADYIVDEKVSYDKPTFPGAPETPFIAARWDDEKHITFWASTQGPNMVGKPFGMDKDIGVTVIAPNCGGSYGNKDSLTYTSMLVAAAAKVAGVPVKYSMTKEEHLLCYERRLSNKFIGQIGLKKDGTVTYVGGDWLVSTGVGAELTQGQVAEGLGETHLDLNKTQNWDIEAKVVCSNIAPVGIARGFGGQELKACLLHSLNHGLKALDIEPVAFYKEQFCDAGSEYYWRDGHKYKNEKIGYKHVFDAAAEKFGWYKRWKGWTTPEKVEGNKAYGLGFSVHSSGDPQSDECCAYVRIDNDQISVHVATPESGMGQRLACAKTAAEILNVEMDKVTVIPNTTGVNPQDFGLAGSRGTITNCGAVGLAAKDAKKNLLEEAAEKMGCTAEELDTKDFMVFKKDDPSVCLPVIAITGLYCSVSGQGVLRGDFAHNNCVMNFVEVCVDLDTGAAKVTDVLCGSDVGQIMSPVELKMQFDGCLGAAALDTAQLEEHVLDTNIGRFMTSNLIDYKWRPFNELPNMDYAILESNLDTGNPFGAIGIGEIVGAAAPPAVMMAIENALSGTELYEYPATPDRILKALKKA